MFRGPTAGDDFEPTWRCDEINGKASIDANSASGGLNDLTFSVRALIDCLDDNAEAEPV